MRNLPDLMRELPGRMKNGCIFPRIFGYISEPDIIDICSTMCYNIKEKGEQIKQAVEKAKIIKLIEQ